jgi:hypothetical protein
MFAEAIWLNVPALDAVEAMKGKLDEIQVEIEMETLWKIWFEAVRAVNGIEAESDLDAA